MSKILFMNTSPDKNGNTFQMGRDYLKEFAVGALELNHMEKPE